MASSRIFSSSIILPTEKFKQSTLTKEWQKAPESKLTFTDADPVDSTKFEVFIDGDSSYTFTKVGAVKMTREVTTIESGGVNDESFHLPGKVTFSSLVLETPDENCFNSYSTYLIENSLCPKKGTIVVKILIKKEKTVNKKSIIFENAFPIKVDIEDQTIDKNGELSVMKYLISFNFQSIGFKLE